jgi:predicted N-acyltransferase
MIIKIEPSLININPKQWNEFSHPKTTDKNLKINPFISYEFLYALEASGSTKIKNGWGGAHILLEDEAENLLAACPAYLKSHSMGEYVFDQGWADAYSRAGGEYYPKLQISVPFTPATAPKLLAGDEDKAVDLKRMLASSIPELCARLGASSAHATFLTEEDKDIFLEAGFLERNDKQYHWFNENYGSFDDFLEALASRKRKLIRRERRDALANGITIQCLTGSDIKTEHMEAFYTFYMDTGSRKWGRPYLTRAFFSIIQETMPDQILLIMAKREGQYIAGAINFIGGDVLYGRNWGCIENHPFLHFEVCYYQAIDFAIQKGLKKVEAGAQGEHKLARGYRPVTTYSAHYIADPSFRQAVANYLQEERNYIAELQDTLSEQTPFRRGERLEDE